MIAFQGVAHQAAQFFQDKQLCNPALWAKFVNVYRLQPDGANQGWRGEYWGKMMRGGALVYAYTQNERLYQILTDTVKDMMTVAEADGRVSSYTRDTEFDGWDLWSRKYVILGMEYYLDICKDEALKAQIISFLRGCTDYILQHVGPGKKNLFKASRHWRGVNSASILEPIVKLYNLTNEKKYLDFATYIVENGGADGEDIFQMAYENKLYPYQYRVSKAYEVSSCFEGLLEYYFVTKNEKYKTAVINYAKAIIDSEMSIVGSCGVTHELLDHTRMRQTAYYPNEKQETCVTVTLMKLFSKLLALTGDSLYADVMEQSFYNAYLGAINSESRESAYISERFKDMDYQPTFMPVDSYSPLTPAKRGLKVGGIQQLHDNSYYGCCACIASAGVGVFLQQAITVDSDGIVVNFFENGKAELQYQGVNVALDIHTAYPVDGNIKIRVVTDKPMRFTLKIRMPQWANVPHGYALYNQEWSDNTIEVCLDMPIKLHYPEYWETDVLYTAIKKDEAGKNYAWEHHVEHKPEDDNYIAVTRGPLTLAADGRTGKAADSVFTISHHAEVCENQITDGVPCLLKLKFTAGDETFCLVDYASAGRDWETLIAAWLPTK